MGFIPIIVQTKTLSEIERGIKYFLVQSIGSALVLLGGCLSFFQGLSWNHIVVFFMVVFGLLLKLGVFPFYFWLPGVMMNLEWVPCVLIATWQKVAPFLVLTRISSLKFSSLVWCGAFSSLVGGVIGINQVHFKALLAYSSIGHIGWILRVSQLRESICYLYLFLYLSSNLIIFILLWRFNLVRVGSIRNFTLISHPNAILVFVFILLTLSGIPPLVGFFLKMLRLQIFVTFGLYISRLILIVGTFFRLYYYISIVFHFCSYIQVWHNGFLQLTKPRLSLIRIFSFNLFALLIFFLKISY